MPKISVIVPVYNVEKYLHRCVDSILRQTFSNFELILVDDGSPDNCPAICDEYAARDSRVVVIHQKNAGQACARNRGIEWALSNSDSRWICFIDSDDWVNGTYLEGLYEAAIECTSMISACDFVKDEIEATEIKETVIQHLSPSVLYNSAYYVVQSPCCKLFSKKLFENTKFRFPEGIIYEDSAVIYKIVFTQEKIAFTNKSTYYYFQRLNSSMNSKWNPRKMVYCQVQRDQLQWLIDHNYDECVKTCLCHYLSTLHYNVSLIQEISEYKKYEQTMRKICREMLCKYSKKYSLTMEEYPQFYQAAYPRFMEIYWITKSQVNKLKRRRKGC